MFLMIRTPRKTVGPVSDKIGGHKRGWNRHYQCISGIRLELQWKLRTLDKPFRSSRLGSDSRRFHSETTQLIGWYMARIGIRIGFNGVLRSWDCG